MKSGVAAMCAAAARVAGDIDGEVVVAAVADEEYESAGTRSLIERGIRADAAIVTEPTRLAIMPAHLGFVWIDVTTYGRAAHGSRWDLGVDAIRHAGLFLAELERFDADELPKRRHALLGRPSVHASMISGGIGMSTYPDKCTVRIERRTIPGESPEVVRREIQAACERAGAGRRQPNFRAEVNVTFAQEPSDVTVDAPIVNALRDALHESNEEVRVQGMTAWTDAALLNAAGVPAICFGPGDIGLAHAAEEYVIVEEIERATRVLERLALQWCRNPVGAWRS
jgi:acetylornithine deacetylase